MITNRDNPGVRGRERMAQLAAQKAAERELEELKTALVDCLGREATAVDIVAIEALASATVSARKQRARGKSDRGSAPGRAAVAGNRPEAIAGGRAYRAAIRSLRAVHRR